MKYFDNNFDHITDIKLKLLLMYLMKRNTMKMRLRAYVGQDIIQGAENNITFDKKRSHKCKDVRYSKGEFTARINSSKLNGEPFNQFIVTLIINCNEYILAIKTFKTENSHIVNECISFDIKYTLDFYDIDTTKSVLMI